VKMAFSSKPTFTPTELESPITEHAVVIAADDGATIYAIGSGFFIASGLVLTAGHVLWGFWDKIEQRPRPTSAESLQFGIHVLQFPNTKAAAPALWAVRRVWTSSLTDAAFMHVVPASREAEDHVWQGSLALSPLPPTIGDRVVGFGYPSSSARLVSRTPLQHIVWELRPHTTVGEVSAIYPDKRDSTLLNFPCFETTARFDGGMSGGPVFNSLGQVSGIIVSALQTDEQGSFTSSAATLWPAMLTAVDFEGPGLVCKGLYQVHELSSIGILHLVGWESVLKRITIERDERGHERPRLSEPQPQS